MMRNVFLAALVALVVVPTAEAGPRARRAQRSQQAQPAQYSPTPADYQSIAANVSTGIIGSTGEVGGFSDTFSGANDALNAVNAKRASRGLPPYIYDAGLTQAAQACASYRAQHRMFGHVRGGSGDFQFLPPGSRADAAGCAAYEPSYGFMACEVYGNYRHAGAAWVMGSDGKNYCHLFVRR